MIQIIIFVTMSKFFNILCYTPTYYYIIKHCCIKRIIVYQRLKNDDVFGDLFVPEDNNHVISKAFDSAIEKCCFRESELFLINDIQLLELFTENCAYKLI